MYQLLFLIKKTEVIDVEHILHPIIHLYYEYDVIEGAKLVNTKENPQITYPDGKSPLDNLVYSSENWKFSKITVVTQSYSDHYMIHSQGTFTKKK